MRGVEEVKEQFSGIGGAALILAGHRGRPAGAGFPETEDADRAGDDQPDGDSHDRERHVLAKFYKQGGAPYLERPSLFMPVQSVLMVVVRLFLFGHNG